MIKFFNWSFMLSFQAITSYERWSLRGGGVRRKERRGGREKRKEEGRGGEPT